MKKTTYLVIIAIACFLLPGCIGAEKYTQYISEAAGGLDASPYKSISAIKINSTLSKRITTIAEVKKGDTYFIPALVYWAVKENYECELNTSIAENIFRKTCSKMADSSYFATNFKGEILEINITSLPTQFRYFSKTEMLYFGIAFVALWHQAIIPNHTDLSVSYKLYSGSTVLKEGKITIDNYDKILTRNYKNRRKITRDYLAQYEKNMHHLSSDCFVQLSNELKGVNK